MLILDFNENIIDKELDNIVNIFSKEFDNPITIKDKGITTLVENPQKALEKTLALSQKHGFLTTNISIKEPSLEDIFLLITGHKVRE